MRIIIDGYNLLFSSLYFNHSTEKDISTRREELIKCISDYQLRKGLPITIVFDGNENGFFDERREKHYNLEIIYSREDEEADDVIKRLVERNKNGCMVISSDREIKNFAEEHGAAAIPIQQFIPRLTAAFLHTPSLKDETDYPDRPLTTKKKGNPSRLPRQERRKKSRLNRL